MQRLNLPEFEFVYQQVGEIRTIFDPIRKRYVRLTPEEWVRQHLVQYLIQDRGFPQSLIAIERGFAFQGMQRRADVVVYDRSGKPVLMAECKSPDVSIKQAAFDQIARYNTVVQARYLLVTNGLVHYCALIDRERQVYTFMQELPRYEEL